jgi:uncharacterized protein YceH (UPF0502 family)
MQLSPEAQRVLGCLVEKQRTVPASYPMTLSALVAASNQSSNRWPVVDYDAGTVQRALDELKGGGLVRFVHAAHGERVTKYRHVADERLGLEPGETAVLAVLLLRGPQTAGELRARTERLHPFESVAEVEAVLARLAGREDPLAVALPRAPGRKEPRFAHLLGGPVDLSAPAEPVGGGQGGQGGQGRTDLDARVAALERKVAHLYALLGEEEADPPGA